MIKITVIVVGLAGMGLAFKENSVLPFWILGSDLMYTVILPQLICVVYFPISNMYGAVGGYIVGVMMRLLGGEPLLYLPPAIHFPGCKLIDGSYIQHFPYRSLAMLLSLCATILISYVMSLLFERDLLPKRWDLRQVGTDSAPHISVNVKANADDEQPAASDQLVDTNC